jgi:hypothetical protein
MYHALTIQTVIVIIPNILFVIGTANNKLLLYREHGLLSLYEWPVVHPACRSLYSCNHIYTNLMSLTMYFCNH